MRGASSDELRKLAVEHAILGALLASWPERAIFLPRFLGERDFSKGSLRQEPKQLAQTGTLCAAVGGAWFRPTARQTGADKIYHRPD
jgi:hypothetical protein